MEWTITIRKELEAYLNKCNSVPINNREFTFIYDKLKSDQLSQIIFDFGDRVIMCILKYFENKEEYLYCQHILDKITTHNRVNNTSINGKDL